MENFRLGNIYPYLGDGNVSMEYYRLSDALPAIAKPAIVAPPPGLEGSASGFSTASGSLTRKFLYSNTLDVGSGDITVANSGVNGTPFSNVSTIPAPDYLLPYRGAKGGYANTTSSNDMAYVGYNVTEPNTPIYTRQYFRVPVLWTSSTYMASLVWSFTSDSSDFSYVAFTSGGKLIAGGTSYVSGTYTYAIDTWYRLETKADNTSIIAKTYLGDSTTPLETITSSRTKYPNPAIWGFGMKYSSIGSPPTIIQSSFKGYFDEVAITNVDWIGPAGLQSTGGFTAGTSTAIGTLTKSIAIQIAGTTTGTSTAIGTATVSAAIPISGTAAGSSSLVAAVVKLKLIEGRADGTSTAIQTDILVPSFPLLLALVSAPGLLRERLIASVASGNATATGTLSISAAVIYISGTTAGTSTASATLIRLRNISSVVIGSSTVSGTLLKSTLSELAGTIAGSSSATGMLLRSEPLAGQSLGDSDIAGTLITKTNIYSLLTDGFSTIIGSIVLDMLISGITDGDSEITGGLSRRVRPKKYIEVGTKQVSTNVSTKTSDYEVIVTYPAGRRP